MIRLFVTDLDGTLMPEGGSSIVPRYFRVITELKEKGMIFGAATGRPVNSVEKVFAPIRDEILYISENGGYVQYGGEILLKDPMTLEDSRRIVRDTRLAPGCYGIYDTGTISYFEKGAEEAYHVMKDEFRFDSEIIDDLLTLEEPCIKFTVYRNDDVEAVSMEHLGPRWADKMQMACAGHRFMDMMKKGVTKGTALKKVQEHFGILPEETLAIGDNINDLEMLDVAGYSIAIGSARDEVKEKADYVTGTASEDGVLMVLEALLSDMDNADRVLEQFRRKKG